MFAVTFKTERTIVVQAGLPEVNVNGDLLFRVYEKYQNGPVLEGFSAGSWLSFRKIN